MLAAVLTNTANPEKAFVSTLSVKEIPNFETQPNESVINIQAAALNHRDVWILKGKYPGIKHDSILGSDAVGFLVKKGTAQAEVGQRVLISPSVNWASDPRGPEGKFGILGLLPSPGTVMSTLAEKIHIDGQEVFPCPEHLSTAEAAALPLAGLTAYRALFTKAELREGDHVLITGIGGGVALFALQFAVAAGATVYVTSSSPEKIQKAIELGAKGGINYNDANAINELKKLLGNNLLSSVIDGSGGPLFDKYARVLRQGGIIAQYGQTASPQGISFNMSFVLKNIEVRGSTMGSRAEFNEMLAFVNKHKLKPVVSHVFYGLTQENVDHAIDMMREGRQFGKIVIEVQNTRQKL
ncbi:hypothetical protein BX666DRAFT_1858002 [Dichotomocladium elegans]|nr:hypothetical protein BX666DRAFT_1858002 [Dichotomocladium elegans]